jgi:YD repeat-containing protein
MIPWARLVTVYDASGNAAVYKYDAVGNLLSITNSSSTTFAALELSSSSGIAGSTVTIYGTGFCSNPTVTFNGVAATVVSAATTRISVRVSTWHRL